MNQNTNLTVDSKMSCEPLIDSVFLAALQLFMQISDTLRQQSVSHINIKHETRLWDHLKRFPFKFKKREI